jgi:LPS-assembly lipoprotein
MRTLALLVIACASVAGCGLRPAYGPQTMRGDVSVGEIEGRTGYALRQELLRLLAAGIPGVPAEARLEISLQETINRLAFAPDQAASRSDYVGTASFRLIDGSGVTLAEGVVSDAASFNFADSAFADISAQSAAQDRLAGLLARSIRHSLLASLAPSENRPR